MIFFKREKVIYSNDRCIKVIEAVLKHIRFYLDIGYWNFYQKDMVSPFDNSSAIYQNRTFTVRAYNWNNNNKPNFEYKGLKVWWYKYCGRGMYAKTTDKITVSYLSKMIEDCMTSIIDDFRQKRDKNESDNCRRA